MGPIRALGTLFHDLDHTIQPKPGIIRKVLYILDSGISYGLFGATQRDYLDFEFHRKTFRERNTFLTGKRYARMVRVYNNHDDGYIFMDKAEFNQVFAEHLGRACLNMQDANAKDYFAFVQGKDAVFVKPRQGEKGHGLTVESVKTLQDEEKLFRKLKGQPFIVEEKIIQHQDLAAFNSHTVNTLRLYTLLEKNNVRILSASLKMGRYQDSIADNISAGGIFATVDPKTGMTMSAGVDKDHFTYEFHPLSKKRIIGTTVPSWDEVMVFVDKIARVVPTVRYVGWDIGIDRNGHPLVIEGNHNGGRRALQFADQIGKYPLFTEMK